MKNSKKLLIFTVILLIINAIIYATHWGGDLVLKNVSDWLPVICSFISSLCLFSVYKEFKQFDFTKTVWLFMLIGIGLYFIAESTYALLDIVFKVDVDNIFPSFADFFWCIGYIPMFIGLFMMFAGYKKSGFPMGNKKLYFIISALILLTAVAVIGFILVPIVKDSETQTFTKFFYIFYPVADVLLVIPAILLFYITSLFGKGTISKPWKFMSIGFVCFTVADLLYSYLNWRDLYGDSNLIDLIWHFGYLVIGLAALYQKELIKSVNEIKI